MKAFLLLMATLVLGADEAPDWQVWLGSGARTLTADEEVSLASLPVAAVLEWTGRVVLHDHTPVFTSHDARLAGLPAAARWAVVRIDADCTPLLRDNPTALVAVVAKHWRSGAVGLQIDCAVPSKRLVDYAEFLSDLRQALPPRTGLACTGLLAWLDDPALAKVVAAVDWWVPQTYGTGLPSQPTQALSLVGGGDLTAVTKACEALGRPYRIGLPTFEQVAWWRPDDTLGAAALRVELEDLLAAGLTGEPVAGDGERLWRFRLTRPVRLPVINLPADALVVVGQPTVAGLRQRIATVRAAAGPWFRGISFCCLPEELAALSCAQLAAAVHQDASTPALTSRWRGAPGAWTAEIRNSGTDDVIQAALSIGVVADLPSVPFSGGISLVPAAQGQQVALPHANSLLLRIPFLRAGRAVVLPALPGAQPPTIGMITP